MSPRSVWPRVGLFVGVAIAIAAVGSVFALQMVPGWNKPKPAPKRAASIEPTSHVELVASTKNMLEVPHDVAGVMQLKTIEVGTAPPPTPLKLEGSLFLDPNRLTHVHTRFPGEVVELGAIAESPIGEDTGRRDERTLRFGDQVGKGQLLAVVWSKDLGEKKSEMIDALSRFKLDQETLKRLEKLFREGALPERSLREQERIVESDAIAVSRASVRSAHGVSATRI